jgi:hypothetical protein
MISIGLGLTIGESAGAFSAEYAAVLANGTSRGATLPSGSQQAKQNQLIVDLKTAGIWDKLDAFYMLACDGNSAFALINWKNPSANYGTAANVLPTFTTNGGFTGNASNQAINLNFPANSGTNFASPNASFGSFIGTASTTSGSMVMAAHTDYNKIRISTTSINLQPCHIANNGTDGAVIGNNSFIHINRNGTNARLFLNGNQANNGYYGTFTVDTLNFYLLRNAQASNFGNSQIKMAFIGGDLASLASTFYGTINTYFNNL